MCLSVCVKSEINELYLEKIVSYLTRISDQEMKNVVRFMKSENERNYFFSPCLASTKVYLQPFSKIVSGRRIAIPLS